MLFEGPQFENPSIPSTNKLEEIEGRESITEQKIEPAKEIRIPERKKSTEVEDSLKLKQIREELEKLQKDIPETRKDGEEDAAEQKLKSREMKEKMKKNDIIVGERHAGLAEDLLRGAGIKFEVKRFVEKEQVPNSEVILPGEFIFRLHNNDDESADKAFAILRQAKLECKIVKDVVDLDKQNKS